VPGRECSIEAGPFLGQGRGTESAGDDMSDLVADRRRGAPVPARQLVSDECPETLSRPCEERVSGRANSSRN
jgi:hypothetical protein